MEVLEQAWKRYVYTTVWKNTNIIWDHMYRTEGELTPIQLRIYLYEAGAEIAMLMISKFIAEAEGLEYVCERIESTRQTDIIRECILERYTTKLRNHLNLEDKRVKNCGICDGKYIGVHRPNVCSMSVKVYPYTEAEGPMEDFEINEEYTDDLLAYIQELRTCNKCKDQYKRCYDFHGHYYCSNIRKRKIKIAREREVKTQEDILILIEVMEEEHVEQGQVGTVTTEIIAEFIVRKLINRKGLTKSDRIEEVCHDIKEIEKEPNEYNNFTKDVIERHAWLQDPNNPVPQTRNLIWKKWNEIRRWTVIQWIMDNIREQEGEKPVQTVKITNDYQHTLTTHTCVWECCLKPLTTGNLVKVYDLTH